jgi:hypothetical protein
MKKNAAPVIAAILLLMPLLYVGSYLALVRPTTVIFNGGGQKMTFVDPHYRFGGQIAESFFWPLEEIDRVLRPDAWKSDPVILRRS